MVHNKNSTNKEQLGKALVLKFGSTMLIRN